MSFDEAVIVSMWLIATVFILGLGIYELAVKAWRGVVQLKDTLLNGCAEDVG